ncbi:MAG TPA: DUF2283 domain-containing protein [Candidatus Nanoarchaeia archaeon]|nr:DUF2283 domain-containing protein [Candidatus Nanoarchaeia archaeon]
MKSWYDKEEDILNIELQDKAYWKSIELKNGIVLDISLDGSITGIEILKASKIFLGDNRKVIEAAEQGN